MGVSLFRYATRLEAAIGERLFVCIQVNEFSLSFAIFSGL